MRKIILIITLLIFSTIQSYSFTVNIGIWGITQANGSVNLTIKLSAIGGDYHVTGNGSIIFALRYWPSPPVTFSNENIYSGISYQGDQTGTSGYIYRTYYSENLNMNLTNGSSIVILTINANNTIPTSFFIPEVDDGPASVKYYIDNQTNDVTGIADPNEFDAPMPVELMNFLSSVNNNNIQLNWTTNKEINNKGFYIERAIKSDVLQWSQVTFLEGKNGSNINQYTYTDKKLETGKYNYRLKQCDYNGNYEYYNLSNDVEVSIPKKFEVSQNYPNPFNPLTNIDFQLPYDSKVSLIIFDIVGREIIRLINQECKAGYYIKSFDASNISSGMYFYRLIADSPENKFIITKKMIVVK
jgi:hypothetical protein